VEYQSKSDIVTSAIRDLIVTGEFGPGAVLRQRDLAKRFAVSPTPVREALRRLEAEGLVHSDVHRGATVIETDYAADEENFKIRAVLESMAAGLAARRIDEESLEALEELNRQMAARPAGDPAIRDLNRRLHFLIYESSHSPLLLGLLRLLWQSFPRGPYVVRPHSESVRQHRELIGALRQRNSRLAERLTKKHILSAFEDLKREGKSAQAG
jgi:DNA-binding GntR family transcriptional regulator